MQRKNLNLNKEKLQLREAKVPFIGHITSDQGLLVDPEKTRAIADMTVPTDKAVVHRLLAVVQYLGKLLPQLSDLTKPLRDLLQKDVEWWWGDAQQRSFEAVRKAVCSTPVLRYYNLHEEVTLQ